MEFDNPMFDDTAFPDDAVENQIETQAQVHAEMDPETNQLEKRLRTLRGQDNDETFQQARAFGERYYWERYNNVSQSERKRLDEVEKLRRFYQFERMNPYNRLKLADKIDWDNGDLYFD